ncbi:MAG: ATP-binding protein [Deltaproteobacteria bacterium]|nr:ATP-binding protein [Deltaproteobacteria bacterium]
MVDWHLIYAELRQRVGDHAFETWVAPSRPIRLEDETLTLSVPDRNHQKEVQRNFEHLILEILREHGFTPGRVEYVHQREPDGAGFQKSSENVSLPYMSPQTLNPDYTFETFIVDDSNRFPYQVCLEVSNLLDPHYNPLLLYSSGGFGKTHLLQAMGNFAVRRLPEKSTCYTNGGEFAGLLHTCLKWNALDRFQSYFHSLDLILLDDVHQLAPFPRAQDEFVNVFNKMYNLQRQIVVSTQELPKNIVGLEDRLRSRLSWGLIAEIASPSVELKEQLTQRKCGELGISLDHEVVRYLAQQSHLDAVALDKCLIRMAAYMSVQKKTVDIEQARTILSGDAKRRKTEGRRNLKEIVADFFDLSTRDLDSNQKNRSVAFARQVGMYLMRSLSGQSYSKIAFQFGEKNHSTAVRACAKIERLIRTDRKVEKIIRDLNMLIRS